MKEVDSKTYFPELVFCISAAAGTDSGTVSEALAVELAGVDYVPVPLKLSKLMGEIPGLEYLLELKAEDERIRQSMIAGNEIRRVVGRADAVASLALTKIQETRKKVSGDSAVPAERHAFIISSLKRPEELEMFRKLFGQRAILVSVYEHILRVEPKSSTSERYKSTRTGKQTKTPLNSRPSLESPQPAFLTFLQWFRGKMETDTPCPIRRLANYLGA